MTRRSVVDASSQLELWTTCAIALAKSIPVMVGPALAITAFASLRLALRRGRTPVVVGHPLDVDQLDVEEVPS